MIKARRMGPTAGPSSLFAGRPPAGSPRPRRTPVARDCHHVSASTRRHRRRLGQRPGDRRDRWFAPHNDRRRRAGPVVGNGPRIEQFRLTMDIASRFCLLVAGVMLVTGSSFAQPAPTPNPAPPADSTTPDANQPSLSEKLRQSNGVIHPKEVDPAIEKQAPKVRDQNVVPAPGTSGGAPAPQPK